MLTLYSSVTYAKHNERITKVLSVVIGLVKSDEEQDLTIEYDKLI